MNGLVENEPRSVRRLFLLWFGFLGGAIAWAGHLLIAYSLVPLACRTNLTLPLYAVTVATAAVALAAVVAAWKSRRDQDEAGLTRRATTRSTDRFLAWCGILLSSLFLLVIIVQSLPIFLQSPCDTAGRLGI